MYMETENIFGRKIFFLYPSTVINEELIQKMIHLEYEVYVLNDKDKAGICLQNHPDSICFINIDTLAANVWLEFIQKMQKSPATANVSFGIITNSNSEEQKKLFTTDLKLDCGFISLREGNKHCLDAILSYADNNHAKGRRKYIRINCETIAATVNFVLAEQSFLLKIRDISSVGLCCFPTDNNIPRLAKGMMLKNAQLTLKGIRIQCDLILLGANKADDRIQFVMLFAPNFDLNSKNRIKAYIQQSNQSAMESLK